MSYYKGISMKKIFVLEILFICILGVTGWQLFGLMKKAKTESTNQIRIERSNNLLYVNGAGIDISGNKIESILVNSVDEVKVMVAAFLLRHDSLNADLKFWNEVGSQLAGFDAVRLTAYCEDARCVETVRKNPDMAHVTIMEYGFVVDMQAVSSADADGMFWLRINRNFMKIKWRDKNLTPYDIVNRIKQSGA